MRNSYLQKNKRKVDWFSKAYIKRQSKNKPHNCIIWESVFVDASTFSNQGFTKYRGVNTQTKKVLFEHSYPMATNNIGKFLAIIHAVAWHKKNKLSLPVLYTDSYTAMSWVNNKRCNTKLKRTKLSKQLFDDISRAIIWLNTNKFDTKILKWNTKKWGKIPENYERKL